jgi:hypothetical protein
MLTVEMAVAAGATKAVEDELEVGMLCVVLDMLESGVLDSGMLSAGLDLCIC